MKPLTWFIIQYKVVSAQCWKHFCLGSLGQVIISYGRVDYHITCTVIHCLPLQCLGEAIGVHRYLKLILVGHAHSQWSWKVKPIKHCPFPFSGMGCHLQWYVTMPKKWSLVRLAENSRRHCVIWNRWSYLPHGQMQLKERKKELKKGSGRKLIETLGWLP